MSQRPYSSMKRAPLIEACFHDAARWRKKSAVNVSIASYSAALTT